MRPQQQQRRRLQQQEFLFVGLSCGVFFTYVLYALVEEAIFQYKGFHYGWFLTFFQFMFVSVLADISCRYHCPSDNNSSSSRSRQGADHETSLSLLAGNYDTPNQKDSTTIYNTNTKRIKKRSTFYNTNKDIMVYAMIGLLDVISMGFSNSANEYISYPTKVLFKSSKLLPVMIVGKFLFQKQFHILQYIAAICIVSGLILITVADNNNNNNNRTQQEQLSFNRNNKTGIIMVLISILSDSFMGNLQSMVLNDNTDNTNNSKNNDDATNKTIKKMKLLYYSYRIGSLYLFIKLVMSNELLPAIHYMSTHTTLLYLLIIYSALSFIGLSFVLSLINHFDIFITVVTITCRQFFTICLSYFISFRETTTGDEDGHLKKKLTKQHILALCLVFVGIGINIMISNSEKIFVTTKYKKTHDNGKDPRHSFVLSQQHPPNPTFIRNGSSNNNNSQKITKQHKWLTSFLVFLIRWTGMLDILSSSTKSMSTTSSEKKNNNSEQEQQQLHHDNQQQQFTLGDTTGPRRRQIAHHVV